MEILTAAQVAQTVVRVVAVVTLTEAAVQQLPVKEIMVVLLD